MRTDTWGGLHSLRHSDDCDTGKALREGKIVFYFVRYDTYNTDGFLATSF